MPFRLTGRVLAAGALAMLMTQAALAALPVPAAKEAIDLLPPPTEVRMASRAYPVTTLVRTNHKGWRDASGYANVAQDVRVQWDVHPGGEAILQGRDAWNPHAPWRELGHWLRGGPGGTPTPERGETTVTVAGPTLLWLRVRAPRWPRSGIAGLRADYVRHTIAVLHGTPGPARRPVILAEGYDPFNTQDLNDPAWQDDPTIARLVAEGRRADGLDTWLLDWGDGAAPIEEQARDFSEIARQVREWNGGRDQTVAVGISMGAISVQY